MKKISLAIASVLLFAATNASAAPQAGDFYVGAGLGASKINSAGLTKATDTTIGVLAGYHVNEYLAVEGAYTDMGLVKTQNATSIGLTSFSIAGIGSYAINDDTFVVGKLGMASNTLKAGVSSATNSAAVFGVGVRYQYNNQLGFRGMIDSTQYGTPSVSGVNYSLSGLYSF